MKTADKKGLMERLAGYGYVLQRPKSSQPAESLLVDLLKQDEARLLEGFPVVLARRLRESGPLSWENKKWNPSTEFSLKIEKRLGVMLAFSYQLFKLFGLEKEYGSRALKVLARLKQGAETARQVQERFLHSEPFLMGDVELSSERLKTTFRNYALQNEESADVQKKQHALELELLLSELFTPRQKELLKKRLEGKEFTKTERETYYRVVKKRLKALANDELHQMARTVLER